MWAAANNERTMANRKGKTAKMQRRLRVKRSVRKKVQGTSERPRLSVFRSNKNIYAQLIDDRAGHTVTSASSLEQGHGEGDSSEEVGHRLAARATAHGISAVVFDRNGYRYLGQVQSLADGARKGGLVF